MDPVRDSGHSLENGRKVQSGTCLKDNSTGVRCLCVRVLSLTGWTTSTD